MQGSQIQSNLFCGFTFHQLMFIPLDVFEQFLCQKAPRRLLVETALGTLGTLWTLGITEVPVALVTQVVADGALVNGG